MGSGIGLRLKRQKGGRLRKDARGFSLIELLIVVAIILVIAAIAIPNFLRSRMAANHAAAVQSLRTVNSAEVTYSSTYGGSFSSTLPQLGPPASGNPPSAATADLIDGVLASGLKGSYSFTYSPTMQDSSGNYNGYNLNANPVTPGTSGIIYYFSDQTYVIRQNSSAVAGPSDSPISD